MRGWRQFPHQPEPRPAWRLCLALLVGVAWVENGQSQERPVGVPQALRPIRPGGGKGAVAPERDRAAGSRVVIETSAPIANLFARAEEGIEREDWKLAIDSLQRIIEDPEGSLLPRVDGGCDGGVLYESARRQAIRELASLPLDGRAAYGLVYDGKAKGIYERAVAAHDVNELRGVVHRYLLTRWGDDASDVLSSWALDEGRPGEALAVIRDLLELVPDFDVSRPRLLAKIAAAQAMAGRADQAGATLDEILRGSNPSDGLAAWVPKIVPASAGTAASTLPTQSLTTWSLVAASGERMAMPATEPTLVDPVPWSYELSRLTSYTWQRITDDDAGRPAIVPTNEVVLDAERLFARVPGGVIALDREDLGRVWESTFRGPMAAPRVVADEFAEDDVEIQQTARSMEDDVAGSLSVAGGLVLSVEREGRARRANAADRAAPRAGAVVGEAFATRIVARDARTGAKRWHRGRTFDAADPLGLVEFRAAPVACGADLWVPTVANNDLFLVALDPSDGAERHRLLLCSFPDGKRRDRPALPVTASDGVIYVPSAFGALFAVDAATRSLRWAHRYGEGPAGGDDSGMVAVQRNPPSSGSENDGARWLAAPPVVVGGTVLHAPIGGGELLAFSATDGAFQWSTPCPGGSFVIAADVERVWVGGRRLTCLSTRDGHVHWTTEVRETPTGRAALCGERLLVPTAESLLVFDAAKGQPLGRSAIPSQQMPLGNLVCDGAASYSYEPSSIRKYPDLARAYAAAEQGLATGQKTAAMLVRLAWMELFRGNARRSLELLQRLPGDSTDVDPRRSEAAAHLHVEALLTLGADPSTPAAEAFTLLSQAQRAARSAEDRWRVTTRLAERQHLSGEILASYRTLRDASLSSDADTIVRSEPYVLTKARLDLGRRMRALEPELGSEQRSSLREAGGLGLREAMESARSGAAPAARKQLLKFAELAAPASQAAEALLELASIEAADGNTERAEALLGECARMGASQELQLRSLVRMLELQQGTGARAALESTLQKLERGFGPRPVPAELRALWSGGESASTTTIAELARAWRRELDTKSSAVASPGPGSDFSIPDEAIQPAWCLGPTARRQTGAREPFTLVGDLKRAAEATGFETPRLVHLQEPAQAALGDRALFHAPGDILYCQRPGDGALLWQTTLRAPESFADGLDVRRGQAKDAVRRAAVDGEIGVFNSNEGLFGIGLRTGRRLWFHALTIPSEPGLEFARDRRMDARDGIVAAVAEPGHLKVLRLIDGSLLWERDLRGEPVDSLRLVDGVIVTIDKWRQRVQLFDASDGRHIARVAFRQPDPASRVTDLVVSGGVICGPDSDANGDAVIAVDAKSGAARWRVPVAKPLAQLFEPSENYLGIGLLGGDLQLLDAATGELVTEHRVNVAQAVMDALVVDTNLIVRANTTQTGERRPMLLAIDITSGEELWRRTDLPAAPGATVRLQHLDGAIPVVVEYQRVSASAAGLDPRCMGIAMIDVKTGANRYLAAELVAPRVQNRPNGDFELWPGVMIVGTGAGVMAYRTSERGSN